MKLIEQMERLQKIHKMIAGKRTGTPADFARKLGIGERQLYNILDQMKVLLPIEYCKTENSYYYAGKVEVIIKIENLEELTDEEKRNINGGFSLQTMLAQDMLQIKNNDLE